jgi:hypothetical protein
MENSNTRPGPSSDNTSDEQFHAQMLTHSKFKQRSHDIHHNIHIPELNTRLHLNVSPPPATPSTDPFTPPPNLTNLSPISVIYLGNSMLERLKTSGSSTRLSNLSCAWNAGVGGDKTENVLYRLSQCGLYDILKTAQREQKCDIKLWILASGTNNLHAKRGLSTKDAESWKVLVQACRRIAPRSQVLCCDVFYRTDVRDGVVDEGNDMLERMVEGMRDEGVLWVEARQEIGKDMLDDHVHLNEEGYRVWDGVLWPYVVTALGLVG